MASRTKNSTNERKRSGGGAGPVRSGGPPRPPGSPAPGADPTATRRSCRPARACNGLDHLEHFGSAPDQPAPRESSCGPLAVAEAAAAARRAGGWNRRRHAPRRPLARWSRCTAGADPTHLARVEQRARPKVAPKNRALSRVDNTGRERPAPGRRRPKPAKPPTRPDAEREGFSWLRTPRAPRRPETVPAFLIPSGRFFFQPAASPTPPPRGKIEPDNRPRRARDTTP